VNYYERHLGDYAKNADHLSLLEHGVYVRLLDKYYTQEGPIPDAKAARLIRAETPETLQALQNVLEEFFELREGMWHQDRADEEIAAYRQGEPEREAKRSNEELRLQRHREERASLFRQLNATGRHAPYNIGIAELRKLVSEGVAGDESATALATQPATPATATATLATATQYPVPNTHTPDKEKEKSPTSSDSSPTKVRKVRESAPLVSLKTWIEAIKAKGEKPIPSDDEVFTYAEGAGIPRDFLHLAWLEFRHAYAQPGAKHYRDWRIVFRKAVRQNWLKLWWFDGETCALTTVGLQAQRTHQPKDAAA
jgi:uncharacterized protein YdaU (DUF1376 family)